MLPHDAEAVVTFLPTEHGGKNGPTFSNYRAQFYYRGCDWDAAYTFVDVERVNPGDTVGVILSFLSPDQHFGKLGVGTPFLVREGHKIVAYGSIMKLVDLEKSARKAMERNRQEV